MEILSTIFYFIIVISILVFVHEWGHFIAARLCGMRAEIFSIGMGRRVIGYNSKTGFSAGELPESYECEGETDYRISLLPFGGYVKVAGMIDESMDKTIAESEPKEWEFRSKNALQKIFVLSNGVIMNLIFAILAYATLNFVAGKVDYQTTQISFVEKSSIADEVGLKSGDEVVSISSQKVSSWGDLQKLFALEDMGEKKAIVVKRDGNEETLIADGSKILKAISENKGLGFYPSGLKVWVSSVETLGPAGQAGMLVNDTLLSIAGQNVASDAHLRSIVKSNKGNELDFQVKRGSTIVDLKITPNEQGMVGVLPNNHYTGKVTEISYSAVESLSLGYTQTVEIIGLISSSIAQIFTGNIKFDQAVGGPIMIAKQSGKSAEMGWKTFLQFLATLSVSLALMNILPFPALDGGHIVIVLIEAIIRRELPIKVKMWIQQAGVIILLLFIAYVFYVDIMR